MAQDSVQTRKVWFVLVDTDGNALSTADSVRLPIDGDVADFRKLVKGEAANTLANVDTFDLRIYAKADDLKGDKEFDPRHVLHESDLVGTLLVVVPKCRENEPARSSLEETKQAVREVMREQEQEKSAYAISTLTSEKDTQILRKLKIREKVFQWGEPVDTCVPGFRWNTQDLGESKEIQRTRYMEYLRCHLKSLLDTGSFHLEDVSNDKNLLTIVDPRLPFRLNGTADVLLINGEVINRLIKLTGVSLVIELKKKVDASHIPQAHAQLVSSSLKAPVGSYPMSLLTDLNDTWHFSWFSEEHLLTQVTLTYPKNAFDFIKAAVFNKDGPLPFNVPDSEIGQPPLKRLRLDDFVPYPDDGAEEMMERYELMADVLEPEFLDERRDEYARHLVQTMPMYAHMYS